MQNLTELFDEKINKKMRTLLNLQRRGNADDH